MSLIKMQSDIHLYPEQRINYKNVFDKCLGSIEKSVLTMWRRSTPTIMRAMKMNIGMLGPYDAGKYFLVKRFGEFAGLKSWIYAEVHSDLHSAACLSIT